MRWPDGKSLNVEEPRPLCNECIITAESQELGLMFHPKHGLSYSTVCPSLDQRVDCPLLAHKHHFLHQLPQVSHSSTWCQIHAQHPFSAGFTHSHIQQLSSSLQHVSMKLFFSFFFLHICVKYSVRVEMSDGKVLAV